MWLYNSKEDSYWIGLWMEEMVLTRDQDSSEESCFEKNYHRTQILPHQERNLLALNKRRYIWSRELLWSLSHRRNILIFAAALNISWAHHLIRWDKISQQISVPMKEGIIFFADNTIHWFSKTSDLVLLPRIVQARIFSQLHSQFPAQIEKVHNIIQ